MVQTGERGRGQDEGRGPGGDLPQEPKALDDPHEPGGLSNEDLALRIKAGQTELYPVLWEQVRRFVAKQAARRLPYNSGVVEADDLLQAGYIAMIRAVDYFDPEKGAGFLRALDFHLRREFSGALGWKGDRHDPIVGAVSLDKPVGDPADGLTIGALRPSPRDELGDAEREIWLSQLRRALRSSLDALDPVDGAVMRLRYGKGLTLEATAQALHTTRTDVQRREKAAKAALRKDRTLREYVEERRIDAATPWYLSISPDGQNTTGYSTVEKIVDIRERMRQEGP